MDHKWSFKQEFFRKIVHMSSILFVFLYFILKELYDRNSALMVMVLILLFFMIYELVRLKVKNLRLPFSDLARLKEKNKFNAGIYVLVSIIIAFSVFDEKIALASSLMLIFGDTVVGILRHKKNISRSWNKRLYKSAMFFEFLVNFAIGWFVLSNFLISFVMSLVAVIAEGVFDSEDNLAIPLFAGFIGQLLLLVI